MSATLWRFGLVGAALALAGSVTAASRPSPDGEPWRPQFHFTPARNWMNDPNGLIEIDGQYHLFYQYNPQGATWGHMSWGHAVSADLVHWRELPVAIPEDQRYMIFSGSVVFDEDNTSGFGAPGSPPLVAVYTGAERGQGGRQSQQLAYSIDRGRTWVKYPGNPVLDLGLDNFRDPKVFWHAPTKQWVMAAVLATSHQVTLFGSADLKHWSHLSDFGPSGAVDGAWECPDLFPLRAAGDEDFHWVLKVDVFKSRMAGSGAQYFIGRFDGVSFHEDPASGARAVDQGHDFYAAASWSNLPEAPERHVWIGWMSNHEYASQIPTAPWRGAMTLPREVSLRSADGALTLIQSPVAALRALRGRRVHLDGELANTTRRSSLPAGAGNSAEVSAQFSAATADEFGLRVHVGAREFTEIGYDRKRGELYLDRSHSGAVPAAGAPAVAALSAAYGARSAVPLAFDGGRLQLHVWVDRSSVEVFANEGSHVLTDVVFPALESDGVEVFARGGGVHVDSLDVWELGSAVPGSSNRKSLGITGGVQHHGH